MTYRLASRRLYIADLARRQHEMECGRVALQPLAYRVLSRRLREALAGVPEPLLSGGFAELPAHLVPLVHEVLQGRHFEHHGRLPGAAGADAAAEAAALFGRLRSRPSGGGSGRAAGPVRAARPPATRRGGR